MFWLFAVASVLCMVGVLLVVPPSPASSGARFDFVGALGLAVALAALLLALSKGADWGWTSGATLGSAITGVLVLAGWTRYEWRTDEPLIDLRLTMKRTVLLTNVAALMFGFSLFASSVVLPKLLQMSSATGVGLGQEIMTTSLCLVPTGLFMMATAPLAARLSAKRGPRRSLFVGGAVIFSAYALALFLMTEVWHAIVVGSLVGVGIGFAFAALPTLIMSAVPQGATGEANGLNTLMRAIGTAVASTVVAVLLSENVVTLDGEIFTTKAGFQYAFGIAGAAALFALLAAAFVPADEERKSTAPATTETAAAK